MKLYLSFGLGSNSHAKRHTVHVCPSWCSHPNIPTEIYVLSTQINPPFFPVNSSSSFFLPFPSLLLFLLLLFSLSLSSSFSSLPLYFSCFFSFLLVSLSLPTWRALSLPAPISSGYLNSIPYLNYGLENHKDILHAFIPCLGVCLQRSFQTYLPLQLGILLQSGVGSCTEWDAAWDCLYFLKHTHILSLVF